MYNISLITGDGIGPELSESVISVLETIHDKFDVKTKINPLEAGDAALEKFAAVVKRDVGVDIEDIMGAGAAGGLGGGMVAFLGAELAPGVDIVLDTVEFDKHLEGADLVLTGEGALDSQTVYNKAPIGVSRRASQRGIPVIAIAGTLGDHYHIVHEHGISAATSIPNGPMTLESASEHAAHLITDATRQVIRMLKVGGQVFGQKAK